MNKLAIAFVSVAVITVMSLGLFTLATFSDSETSSGNSLQAGTFDLQLKDNNEFWGNGVSQTIVITNMYPGEVCGATDSRCGIPQVELRNVGSVSASSVDITVKNTVVDPPGPESDTEEGTTDMDKMIELVWLEYEDGGPIINLLPLVSDINGNGWKDLDDLEAAPITGIPAPVGTARFQMGVRFHPTADNDYQGDTVLSDFVFTLKQ